MNPGPVNAALVPNAKDLYVFQESAKVDLF